MNSLKMKGSVEERDGTKLTVVHPPDAVEFFNHEGRAGGIEVELAKFGRFQTGTAIMAPLQVPEFNYDGCREEFVADKALLSNFHVLPFNGIVMLEDGGCTFEEKARNVQRMGAQAALIVHNPDEVIDHRAEVDPENRYDGSGMLVHIPTLLIDAQAGEDLLDQYRDHHSAGNGSELMLKADITVMADPFSQSISY